MNPKIFCKPFLINQICEPIIILDDLNDLDDMESI